MPEQALFQALAALASATQSAWLRVAPDGVVISASASAAAMLHLDKRNPDGLRQAVLEPEWRHLRDRLAASGVLSRENALLRDADGRLLHVQLSTLPCGEDEHLVFIIFREPFSDSARQPDPRPLEDGYQAMFIADEQRVLSANGALAEMLAQPHTRPVEWPWQLLVHPGDQDTFRSTIDSLLNGTAARCELTSRFRMMDCIGFREVSIRLCRFWHRGHWNILGTVRDVTDSRRGEAALRDYAWRLRELSRQIIEVQEEERRRLARELHDEIGQQLTILRLQLEKLAPASDDEHVAAAIDAVATLTRQVRSLSLDLRPSMLDDLGLVPTLRWYATHASAVAGFRLALKIEESLPRLSPQIETLCFRVAQEATTNVMRHANATTLSVSLFRHRGLLVLEVVDDGCGFDTTADSGASAGLLGMRERAALSGAGLDIRSTPGKGTRLRLSLPLKRADSRQKRA